jgi:hypothetical protein
MKKFLVIIAVLALTMVSSVAMAEVTMDGSIEFQMRSFKNTDDWNDAVTGAGDYQSTYTRIRMGMNAKTDGAKGRIQLDTDWDQWADSPTTTAPNPGFETRQNGTFAMREGWLDFGLGFGTAHIKVGRQFLQLGNGWFLQSRKYGSDAWLLGMPGKNTVAFVNIKASENDSTKAEDTDAYALLDVFKIDDNNTVGAYIARADDRRGVWTNNAFAGGANFAKNTILDNIGVHYSGKLGPVKLQAEVDFQMGAIKPVAAGAADQKFSGSQFVIQAQLPMDALTFNATLASGSGDKVDSTGNTGTKREGYMTFLDKDARYTMVYEYVMKAGSGSKNTGFANTQAIGLGGAYKISKMFTTNFDIWMLTANEKVSLNGGTASDKLGTEVDLRVTANITDQVSWWVNFGYFMTGDAYKSAPSADPNLNAKSDAAQAIQSVLSYKF